MTQVEGRTTKDAGSGEPRATASRALGRALLFLWSYRVATLGSLAGLLFTAATILAAPQLIRSAVDDGLGQRQIDVLALSVVGLVGLALLRGIATFLQSYLAERASQGVAYDLRDALFVKIERLSFSYYDRVQTGQLLTRLTSDVEQVRAFAGAGLVQLVASVAMLIGSAALLFAMNWRLAIVSLLAFPAIFFLLALFVRRIAPLFGQIQGALGRLNTILQEDLSGLRVIRAFGREAFEVARYRAVNDELLGYNRSAIALFSSNFPMVFLLANLATLAQIWYGGHEVFAGRLTIGELFAFNSYLTFMLFPVLTIGFLAASISRAATSAARLFEILDADLDIQDRPNAVALPPVQGRVRFEDVRFRYSGDDRDALRGISFDAEPGQTIAILGSTGSGKSTLVNLIPRFYDATGGRLTIDGHDVRDVTLASLRSQVGIVLQDAMLFSGSVRDNIAYGHPGASLDEVRAAARAAQAEEFIDTLPDGYDTIVGERGIGLSGGQRQRIAIARALLVNPPLLILDDSTSAVDMQTESLILAALDRLIRDRRRTTFVIAQRISTVRAADCILVIDHGTIAASGTHETLSRESALYNEIVASQLRGIEADLPDELATDALKSAPNGEAIGAPAHPPARGARVHDGRAEDGEPIASGARR